MRGSSKSVKQRRFGLVPFGTFCLLLITLVITGCGGSDSSTSGSVETDSAETTNSEPASDSGGGEPITIGLAESFSGPFEAYDLGIVNAAKLYAEQVNKQGGIDGREVKFVQADVASDPGQGPVAAQEVIDAGAEIVLVSNDFDIGSSAAIAANQAGKLVLSAAGSPKFGVTAIGPLAFTVGTSGENDGAAAADFAYKKGWRSTYILLDDTIDYDKAYTKGFKARWTEIAGADSILGEDTFKNEDASISSQIAGIKGLSQKPDFISLSTYVPGGATAIRQIRAAGIDSPIVASEAMEGSYWLDTVPGLENFYFGAYASQNGDDSKAEVNKVSKMYEAKYGERPKLSLDFMGWTMMQLIDNAVTATGTTEGQALAEYLDELSDFESIVGPVTYTPELHITPTREMTIMENKDGKSAFVEKVTPGEVAEP